VLKGTKVNLVTLNNLQPSTKYFVTVSASTKDGLGEKSLEVSKITNGGNLTCVIIIVSALTNIRMEKLGGDLREDYNKIPKDKETQVDSNF
jgi:hypothetical protein